MAPQRFGSREADQFQLRLPEGLREQVKQAADANGRSMNSELILRIEQSFSADQSSYPEIARLLEAHIQAEVASRLRKVAASLGAAS